MNVLQKVIKYCAMAFAVFLSVVIIGSIMTALFGIAGVVSRVDGSGFGFYEDEKRINLSESYSVSDIETLGIERISIETSEEIIIRPGTELSIDAENVTDNYKIRCSNGRLRFYSTKTKFFFFRIFGSWTERGKVTVTVPEGYIPKEVKIDSGSGRVTIENLNTKRLAVDSGAGDVEISVLCTEELYLDTGSGKASMTDVSARKTSIDSGSGRITAENSELGRLHLDSGSGAVEFRNVKAEEADVDGGSGRIEWTGELTGKCRFDTGSGGLGLQLAGSESDYLIKIDSGSGRVRLNDRKVGDGSYGTNVRGELRIDSSSGSVNINFDEK